MTAMVFVITIITSVMIIIYYLLELPNSQPQESLSFQLWKPKVIAVRSLLCKLTWPIPSRFHHPVSLWTVSCMSSAVKAMGTMLGWPNCLSIKQLLYSPHGCSVLPSNNLSKHFFEIQKWNCFMWGSFNLRYKYIMSLRICQVALHTLELIVLKKVLFNFSAVCRRSICSLSFHRHPSWNHNCEKIYQGI